MTADFYSTSCIALKSTTLRPPPNFSSRYFSLMSMSKTFVYLDFCNLKYMILEAHIFQVAKYLFSVLSENW